MTVLDRFWNYQALGAPADMDAWRIAGKTGPNLESIDAYLRWVYGGQTLGIKPYSRAIRYGTSPSTHTWGALDWRYDGCVDNADHQYRNTPRDTILNDLFPDLINTSGETGIQAIHDYRGCRIWRAWRPANNGGGGWKQQTPDASMGQAWALYVHIEVHPSFWFDGRPFAERMGLSIPVNPDVPPPVPPIVVVPPVTVERTIMQMNKATLRAADRAALALDPEAKQDVVLCQVVCNGALKSDLALDGDYGPKTEAAATSYQALSHFSPSEVDHLKMDGVWGPVTWAQVLNAH